MSIKDKCGFGDRVRVVVQRPPVPEKETENVDSQRDYSEKEYSSQSTTSAKSDQDGSVGTKG